MNTAKHQNGRLMEILKKTDETLLPYNMRRLCLMQISSDNFAYSQMSAQEALYVIYKVCSTHLGAAITSECTSMDKMVQLIQSNELRRDQVSLTDQLKELSELQEKMRQLQEKLIKNNINVPVQNVMQFTSRPVFPHTGSMWGSIGAPRQSMVQPLPPHGMIYTDQYGRPLATMGARQNLNPFATPQNPHFNSIITSIGVTINEMAEQYVLKGTRPKLQHYLGYIRNCLSNLSLPQIRVNAICNSIKRLIDGISEVEFDKTVYVFTPTGIVTIDSPN